MTDQQLAEFRAWVKGQRDKFAEAAVIEGDKRARWMNPAIYQRYDATSQAYGAVLRKLEEMEHVPSP